MEKRTKIVATTGPVSESPAMIKALMQEGVDVFRLNFSHKSHDEADKAVAMIREARQQLRKPIAIMADIKGPALRLYGYSTTLPIQAGTELVIESRDAAGIEDSKSDSPAHVFTNLPDIDRICAIGQKVILMDGYFAGSVVRKQQHAVVVRIENEGALRPKAHLTIPGADYPIPFLSEKDIGDIAWAVGSEIDYIALSFVRCATDIEEVRRLVQRFAISTGKRPTTKLIAKIESARGIANIDEIIHEADGIMIARGDMGVEMPIETVPIAQKSIIRKCYLAAKPVITATQMLESMIENPMPTRAEASDVANACFDSTSAVMLSGETAMGKYPVQVVRTMRSIIDVVEEQFDYADFHQDVPPEVKTGDIPAIMSYNAVSVAYLCGAKALIVLTETGHAARLLSRLRPRMPIYAFLSDERLYNQMALNWGVHPFMHSGKGTRLDAVVDEAISLCKGEGLLKSGDKVVIVAGLPLAQQGTTNMIRVETIQ
ncbi:MAG: pyruvate kinase [Spirochaetaceae bacterium]|nr:pyruvate kinase [Spirochaetaceae bacterium]